MKFPRALRGKKTIALVVVLVLAVAVALYFNRPRYRPPADPRANGAYAFDDGRLAVIVSRTESSYRAVLPDTGEGRALYPSDGGLDKGGRAFHSGPGWASQEPVEVRVDFEESGGEVTGLVWKREGQPERRAAKLAHREEIFTFPSGELTLRGKLVMPLGEGPFPAVVLIHGSEAYSAVDYYREPYLLAAHGFAVLAYDKRGTGKSEGEYTQDFEVLAGDALAGVASIVERPAIDASRVNLAGFSQGGWIAPIAASKSRIPVKSVLVGYGTPLPVTEEDRWGYVYQLHRKGFGDDAIRQADEVNELIEEIADEGRFERFDELARLLDKYRGEAWFEAVKGSDSALGFLTETRIPLFALRFYYEHFETITIDRTVSSLPLLEKLEVPMLWIFGGEDSSLPSPASIEALEALKVSHGKVIDIVLFPDAEHGILTFDDHDGVREILGFEPGYFDTMIEWLRQENELGPEPDADGDGAAVEGFA